MVDVKISIGSHGKDLSFNNFYDINNSKLKNYNFHINKEIEKADFWFVLEDLPSKTENCKVPKNNVIYLNWLKIMDKKKLNIIGYLVG